MTRNSIVTCYQTKTGLKISNPDEGSWSNVVRPESFARKLTAVNQACLVELYQQSNFLNLLSIKQYLKI
jgi:hypothetical protein